MDTNRHYTFLDKLFLGLDQALRALSNNVQTTNNPYPAENIEHTVLSPEQSRLISSLMRVNHAGEICAQALYHGQAIVSRNSSIQEKMRQAAIEEGDHLSWCRKRLDELDSHTSYLNPLWYTGSFCIGMAAGMMGDKWSLGFVAETETQVVSHLKVHLDLLPKEDQRTFHILKQMESDEAHHHDLAIASGAQALPAMVKIGMSFASKIMVKTSYWV
jgi:3-demethoxyubiquinol 3-hydroxylase